MKVLFMRHFKTFFTLLIAYFLKYFQAQNVNIFEKNDIQETDIIGSVIWWFLIDNTIFFHQNQLLTVVLKNNFSEQFRKSYWKKPAMGSP